MTDPKASLALRDDDGTRESGVYLRASSDGIQAATPNDSSGNIADLQQLLRRLRDQLVEVQQLRGRVPTLPPNQVDTDGVAFAEVGLRSLRRVW